MVDALGAPRRVTGSDCTLTPKLIVYRFPVAVQQRLSTTNPSELSLQPHFRSARDQLRLYLSGMRWQHMQKRYFLLDTSMIPGSWTLVTLQALLDEPRGLLKGVVGREILNMFRGGISSNASCIMSCLRPLTQITPLSPTDAMRSSAKPVKFWTAQFCVLMRLHTQRIKHSWNNGDLLSTLFGLCRQTTTFVFLGHPVRGSQWTGDGDGEDPHRHHRDVELLVVNLLLFFEVLQFFVLLLIEQLEILQTSPDIAVLPEPIL